MSAPAFASPRLVDPPPVTVGHVTEKEIAELAYLIWQERGSPSGSPEADWLEAERWLLGSRESI